MKTALGCIANEMHTFVVLFLAAVACADNLEYSYRPVERASSGLLYSPISAKNDLTSSYGSSSESSFRSRNDEGFLMSVTNNVPVNFGGYQTEFFTFTAPDNVLDDHAAAQKIAASLKRKIRVIFINIPENNDYENAVVALAKQAVEQKTSIYVLNKHNDVSDLTEKFNKIHKSKPEVHFVKYRTAQDAANAQEAIQRQYDSLAAASQNDNAGVTPVHKSSIQLSPPFS